MILNNLQIRGVALLFGPILLFFGLDVLVLPMNTFTFREWEALTFVGWNDSEFAFYPSVTITQKEYGDSFRYNQYVKPRTTSWVVDRLGYRNREAYDVTQHYCFATLGDSNTIGSSLDQRELLSEALARKSGCRTYNAGAVDIVKRFFQREEFRQSPPKYVVLQTIAGHFYTDNVFSSLGADGQLAGVTPPVQWYYRWMSAIYRRIDPHSPRANARVLRSIIQRMAAYNFVRARFGMVDLPNAVTTEHIQFRNFASVQKGIETRVVGTSRYRVADQATYKKGCPIEILDLTDEAMRLANCRLIAVVEATSEALRQQGSELILLLQPDGDRVLEAGIRFLRKLNFKIANFPVSEDLPFGIDMDFYWAPDDTHWLPRGVELAADMILAESHGESSTNLLKSRQAAIAVQMQSEINK